MISLYICTSQISVTTFKRNQLEYFPKPTRWRKICISPSLSLFKKLNLKILLKVDKASPLPSSSIYLFLFSEAAQRAMSSAFNAATLQGKGRGSTHRAANAVNRTCSAELRHREEIFCFNQFKRALFFLTFIQQSVTLLCSNLLHCV